MAMSKDPLISEYSVMSKYAGIAKWQFSLTMANFLFLTNNLSVKWTNKEIIKAKNIMRNNRGYLITIQNLPKASSDLSHIAQTAAQIVEFLSDNNAPLNQQL